MSSSSRYIYQRFRHHVLMAVVASILVAGVYFLTPPPDVRHRLSMGTAYAAMAFLVASLWLGPWNVLRRRANPVSFDLRRDLGIWAGALALAHTGVGLTVHLRGRMWMYFLKGLHPVRLQANQFGAANYTGLLAALLFVVLLVISNDASLRRLGTKSWKSLQRWTYIAAGLTVAHGVLFQLIEKRKPGWVVIFYTGAAAAVLVQLAGFLRVRANRQLPVAGKNQVLPR